MSIQAPIFVKPPSIVQSQDDKSVITIESVLKATPQPECAWTLNNRPISMDDRISSGVESIEDKALKSTVYRCFLKIKNAKIDDSGSYRLSAKNAGGELRAAVTISLQADNSSDQSVSQTSAKGYSDTSGGSPPTFSGKPNIKQDASGNRVIFECKLFADPKPDCDWFKNDLKIEAGKGVSEKYTFSMSAFPDNCYLVSCSVNDVSVSDAGIYKVVAKNISGEATAKMTLNFDDDKGRPRISEDISIRHFTTDSGTSIVVQCECEGDQDMHFVWYFNDKEISESPNKYSLSSIPTSLTRQQCTLRIDNSSKHDTGTYRLVAKNQHGEHSANIKLDVMSNQGKIPSGFAPKLAQVPFIEKRNSDLILHVDYLASPKAVITWTKNGKRLMDNRMETSIKHNADNKHSSELIIKNYKLSDAGVFECKAANELGNCTAYIGLKLQANEIVPAQKQLSTGPSMIGQPKIRYDQKRKYLIISCSFQNTEQLNVDWFKAGLKLKDSAKYTMSTQNTSEGMNAEMKIMDYDKDSDDGVYRLQAKWLTGEADYMIHIKSDDATMVDEEEEVKEDENLEEENNKPKTDKTAIDKKGESKDPPKGLAASTKPEDMTEKVKPLQKEAISSTAQPKTKLDGTAPKFDGNFKPVIAYDGDRFELKLTYKSDEPVDVQWTKDGKNIPATEEYDIQHKNQDTVSLTIADAYPQDSGTYRCKISNKNGGDEKACKVTISAKRGKMPRRKPVFKPRKPKVSVDQEEAAATPNVIDSAKSTKLVDDQRNQQISQTKPIIAENKNGDVAATNQEPDSQPGKRKDSLSVQKKPKEVDDADTQPVENVPVIKTLPPTENRPTIKTMTNQEAVDHPKEAMLNRRASLKPVDSVPAAKADTKELNQQPPSKVLRKVSVNKVEKKQDKFGQASATSFGVGGQWPMLRKTTVAKKVPDHWVTHLVDHKANESEGTTTMEATFCRAGGKLRWYKNRVEIFHGQKFNFITEGPVQKLQINKIIPDDSGRYICSVNDVETKAWLEVTPAKPEYDFYLLLPTKNTVFRTKPLFMECHVNSPDCPVKWFKGGKQISADDPRYKFYSDGTRCVLRINKVTRADQDKFTCMIDDENGKTTECYLYVEEPQWRFSKKLPDKIAVDEKALIELVVEVEDPDAECEWFYKGNMISPDELKDNSKYEIIVDGVIRKLIVKNADPDKDAGSYECHTGVMTTECHVQVRPLLRFKKDLKDVECVEEKDVTLAVVLNKSKPMVAWLRDGKRILPSASNVILSEGDTHTLTLKNVSLEDTGRYTVKVDNLESNAYVNVKEADKPPKLGDVVKSVAVSVGKPIHITVPFKGVPRPTVRWLKNGKPIDTTIPSVKITTNDSSSVLEVPKSTGDDKGQYTIVIENSCGKVEANIDVHVCDHPGPPQGPLRVSKITKSDCSLTWNAPEDDGGSPITGYIIEKQDVSRGDWIECEHVPANTHAVAIKNLTANKEYTFRVKAKNQVGVSEPLAITKSIVAKDPYDPPASPENIAVTDVDASFVTLEWKLPKSDGGAPIERFLVEKREMGSAQWMKAAEVPGDQLSATVKNLSQDKSYEFQITAINKAGPGTPGMLNHSVKPEPKIVRPMISRGALTDLTLKVGQTIKLSVPYRAKPTAECRWQKNGQDIVAGDDGRITIHCDQNKCELIITDALRSDVGAYSVTLSNQAGSDTAKANVVVLGPPGKFTKPLKVSDVTNKSAVLSWSPPDDDGGKPIQAYIIEKREPGGNWSEVGTTSSTQYKIPKLKEGQSYEFRVMAQNALGLSEPLQTEQSTVAKNPYDPPGPTSTPIVVSRDRKHIEIEWDPPANDGGAPVIGYLVERKDPDSGVWKTAHLDEVLPSTKFVDNKVTANAQYEYRVKAVNRAGPGAASSSTGMILAKPEREAPKIDASKLPGLDGHKEIRVIAGEPLQIDMDFVGGPNNIISWSKDDNDVPTDAKVVNLEENSKLSIPVTKRNDSGMYKITLKNDLGEDSANVKVVVIAPPGKCTGPIVPIETTKTSATIKWEEPIDNGGVPIDGYTIEACKEGTNDWQTVGTCPSYDCKLKVDNLEPMTKYHFRVAAKNKQGKGEHLQTQEPILIKPPYDPPGQPSAPEITDFDVDHISIEWEKPSNDGGNPIMGYIVEMKDGKGDWIQCSSKPIDSTKYTATALKPNHTYEFRVKAVNDAGPGSPSQSSNQQKAISPINPPDSPDSPTVTNVTKNSATVQWNAPENDGGDKVASYVVEMREANMNWIPVGETRGKDRQLLVPNLKPNSEISFRVIASNKAGPGTPSTPSEVVTVKDPPAPPSFNELSKIRDITVKAGQPFTISTTYTANPEPTIECVNGNEMVLNDDGHTVKAENGVLTISTKCSQRVDSGSYKVTLKNPEGSSTASFLVNVLDTPLKPEGPLEVSTVDYDRCTLNWNKPKDDGGSPITSYVIEKCPVGSNKWTKAAPTTSSTVQTIKNLDDGVAYEFRVFAENENGRSEPLVISEPVVIKSPHKAPDAPGSPVCTDHTETSLTVAWDKPMNDGGAAITGYLLEFRNTSDSQWKPYNTLPKPMKSATVNNLADGQLYEFRVAAVNIAGQSPWVSCDEPIQARPPDASPFIPFTMPKTIKVVAGQPLTLDVPFVASPIPECSYTKNGFTVAPDERHVFSIDQNKSALNIPSAKLEDAGAYTCTLKNNLGQAECNIHVTVIDKPTSPQGPLTATNLSPTGCTLSWDTPLSENGSPITNYVIEKCDVATGKWEFVSKFCRDPKYEVYDLDENHTYKFRVSAENEAGISEPLEIESSVKAQYPAGRPTSPRNFTVTENTLENVTLAWDMPLKDNGAKIQGYQIEYKQEGTDDWNELSLDPIRDLYFTVDHLLPSTSYQFRICAINAMGKSDFESLDRSFKTKDILRPPQAPEPPEALSVGNTFVQLVWDPPVGTALVGDESALTYKVEMKLPDTDDWIPASSYAVSDNFTTISNLPTNADVEFRVCATNAAGDSSWSESSGKIKVSGYPDGKAPIFTRTLQDVKANPSSSARLEVDFTGSPKPEVRWLKNGLEIVPGIKHAIQNQDEHSVLLIQDVWDVDDGTEFTCEVSNPLGKETCSCKLTVPSPPAFGKFGRQADFVEGERVNIQIPLSGTGDGRQIELKKLDGETYVDASDLFNIIEQDGMLNVFAKEASLGHTGDYVVVAKNGAGTASTHFGLNVLGHPTKPEGPLEAFDITKTSCKLSWKPPKQDGNSNITHYIVERHDLARPSDQWVTVDPHCKSTNIAVEKLLPDHEYEFRVKAVNKIGESPSLFSDSSIVAKLPFSAPKCTEAPNISEVGDDFVRLTWAKAVSDDPTSPIEYHVEKRLRGQDQWQPVKAATAGPLTLNSAEIPNLLEGEEYQFRIIPENEAGLGEPSVESDFVLIRDPYGVRAPQIIKKCEDAVVNEHSTTRFDVEVSDASLSEVIWFKGTEELHSNPDYAISKIGNVCSLIVNNAKSEDNDETFTMKIRNSEGSRSCRANLKVLSKPRIKLPQRYADPQEYSDKDSNIIIRIPYTSNPFPTASWFVNGKPLQECPGVRMELTDRAATLCIDDPHILGDGGNISLQLKNSIGDAETSVSYIVTGKPSQPLDVKAENVYDDCVTLVWREPRTDGGSPLIDYEIEMLDAPTSQWNKIGVCRSPRLVIPNLEPCSNYQFRVKAVNSNGTSEPSAVATITTVDAIDNKRYGSYPSYGIGEDGKPKRGIEDSVPDDYDRLYHDLWKGDVTPRSPVLNTGSVYDKYDVFEELGRSPFAVIHRAVNKATGKNYAVKFVETPESEDVQRVEKEIDKMDSLTDPNIINLQETFQNRDGTALVYELLTGDTLSDQLKKSHQMTEPEAVEIIKQVCGAVKSLHDNNIVHLDLKPESFIGSTQKAPKSIKLADFSLASKVIPNEEVHVSLASTEFSAPEIVNQEPVGFGTDMWAVGALALAILTGDGPNELLKDKAEKTTTRDFEIPSKYLDNISENGKDFIQKLLKRDKNARMNIYEALAHPWLKDQLENYRTLHPNYDGLHSRIGEKYKSFTKSEFPEPRIGIGRTAWYSGRIRREPRSYKLYNSSFDSKEYVPRIYIFKHDSYVLEGDTAEITARVVSIGNVSTKWTKGTEVKMSSRISKRSHKNAYTLEIRRCIMEDDGQYTFTASNDYGDKSTIINLHVKKVKEPMKPPMPPLPPRQVREYSLIDIWQEPNKGPVFTHVLRARVVQAGQTVKLSCTVTGRPQPKIQWFKGSSQISNDEIYMIDNNHGVATLEISKANSTDSGVYRCHAENSMGVSDTSCQVLVQGFSRRYGHYSDRSSEMRTMESTDYLSTSRQTTYSRESISTSRDHQYRMSSITTTMMDETSTDDFRRRSTTRERRQIAASPPEIKEHLVPMTLYEGSILQMNCLIAGRPKPEISWYRDGDLISEDSRISQVYEQNVARLTINPVNVYDSGEYRILAANESGKASSTSTVNVRALESKRLPNGQQVEMQPTDSTPMTNGLETEFTIGKTEMLENGEMNNCDISLTDDAFIGIDEQLTAQQVTISQDQLTDIETSATKSNLDSSISSKNIPNLLYIVKHLKSCILKTGDELNLQCSLNEIAQDQSTILWKRNGRVVPENPDFIKSFTGNDVSLKVAEMFPEDSGVFSVEILDNNKLLAKSSCTVLVYDEDDNQLSHPPVHTFINSSNAVIGSSINLIAKSRDPCSAALWTFDGKPAEDIKGLQIDGNTTDNLIHKLSIENVEAIHQGTYEFTMEGDTFEPIVMEAYINILHETS